MIHRTSRHFFEASSSASLSLSTIREALPTRGLPTAAVGAVRGGGVHTRAQTPKGEGGRKGKQKSLKRANEFLSPFGNQPRNRG